MQTSRSRGFPLTISCHGRPAFFTHGVDGGDSCPNLGPLTENGVFYYFLCSVLCSFLFPSLILINYYNLLDFHKVLDLVV